MSELPFDSKSQSPPAKSNLPGMIFLLVFATPFAGFGLMAVFQGIQKSMAGDLKNGLTMGILGLVFSTIGFGLMYAAFWGRKKVKQTAELQSRFADKPWMLRPDWAAGKIKSRFSAPVGFFLLWSFLALAMSAPAVWNLPREWQKGNHAIVIALIFPVTALWLLGYSFALWRSRRRFGTCFFELAQIPIPVGGTLEGMIQTGGRLELEHGLHLKFSCIRRVVSGSGKNRSVTESILWQDEKILRPGVSLPEPEPGHSGIPIYFRVPDGQPQCFDHGDASVSWRLEARTKMRGPDFAATFDVPVFQVAGTVAGAADGVDPTVSLQMPIDEVRRDEHSKIKVTDGPGGREFNFPAARNLGAAVFTSIMAIIFDGGAVAAFYFHIPVIFPIFISLFGLLISCFAFSAWFKSSRISIDSTGVRVLTRYLVFSRTRQFAAGDVVRFETTTGMTSGSHAFSDIRLVPRDDGDSFAANKLKYQQTGQMPPMKFRISDPRGVVVASAIGSALEANWLAQEMTRALGRT